MTDERELAAEYRKHAKTLRAAARFDEHARTSLILKKIADDYELMARALDTGEEIVTGEFRGPRNVERS
jgi:predicted deacylase